MAFDFSDLPLTPSEARAARNYLGMSQKQAATASGLLLHKIKQYETGNHIPDTQFLQDMKDFYEEKGYDFSTADEPAPGDGKKDAGAVFPGGVVGGGDKAAPGKKTVSMVQHMRIDPSIPTAEVDNMLEHIDRNEEAIAELLDKKVEGAGFFTDGEYSARTAAMHGHIVRLLAENGTLFSKLFGRPLVDASAATPAKDAAKPKSHSELLSKLQADMHGAVAGNKAAVAKVKARKHPETLLESLFG